MSLKEVSYTLASRNRLRNTLAPEWFSSLSIGGILASVETTLTASATANTPGAWLQLFSTSATAETTGCLAILASGTAAANTSTGMLLDIATGASGSEVVVAQGISVSQSSCCVLMPIRIAPSTRVAARIQSSVASRQGFFYISLLKTVNPSLLASSVDVLGTNASTSVGTTMTGSSGTWVEITASTSRDYQAAVLVPSSSSTTGLNGRFNLDIGVGAAGSEVAFGSVRPVSASSAQISNWNVVLSAFGRHIPAGSRLAVRHNLASGPSQVDACIVGVPYA